ncbi:MAG: hypothetical protein WEE89_05520 [Gemmatimonadota bacterium]
MRPSKRIILGATLLTQLGAVGLQAQAQARQAPKFEVDPMWPKPLPNHWILGSAVGVAVDSRDHVFVVHLTNSFNTRTEVGAAQNPPSGECCVPAPTVLEFDPDGNLVKHWGGPADGYTWPTSNHGIAVDTKGNIWIGGAGPTDSHLLKFSRDGKFLLQAGKTGVAAAQASTASVAGDTANAGRGRAGRGGGRGAGPAPLPPNNGSTDSFGGPADIAFDTNGTDAYVADGLRNRRVAVIDANTGAIKRVFGGHGNKPDDAGNNPAQQFGTPVRCAEPSRDGMIYVCDRSNNRIQVFRKNGTFVKEKVIAPNTKGAGSVWDITFSRDPQQRFMYVADGQNMKVYILDRQSLDVITEFGDGGRQPGRFYAVHSIATDSKGNIYTVETFEGKRLQKFNYKGLVPATAKMSVWPGAR